MRECDSPAGHPDAKSRASPGPAGPSPASLACPGALSPSPTSAPQSRGPALSRSGEPCSLLTDHLRATGSHPAAPRHPCQLSATPHRLALPGPAPGQPGPDAMPHPYPQRPTLDVSTRHPRTKRGPRRASRSSSRPPPPRPAGPAQAPAVPTDWTRAPFPSASPRHPLLPGLHHQEPEVALTSSLRHATHIRPTSASSRTPEAFAHLRPPHRSPHPQLPPALAAALASQDTALLPASACPLEEQLEASRCLSCPRHCTPTPSLETPAPRHSGPQPAPPGPAPRLGRVPAASATLSPTFSSPGFR